METISATSNRPPTNMPCLKSDPAPSLQEEYESSNKRPSSPQSKREFQRHKDMRHLKPELPTQSDWNGVGGGPVADLRESSVPQQTTPSWKQNPPRPPYWLYPSRPSSPPWTKNLSPRQLEGNWSLDEQGAEWKSSPSSEQVPLSVPGTKPPETDLSLQEGMEANCKPVIGKLFVN